MKIYNAENMLLGRLCSAVAKDTLLGETVRIVNCEKAMVSGSKRNLQINEKKKLDRRGHPLVSQKRPRLADRYVRRSVRGMLPWTKARGKEAFDRVMCYVGVPEELQSKQSEFIVLKDASIKKLPNKKYLSVGQIIKYLGGKV